MARGGWESGYYEISPGTYELDINVFSLVTSFPSHRNQLDTLMHLSSHSRIYHDFVQLDCDARAPSNSVI
jgi:hypothetical protein